jgi:hypothetical protein
MVGAFHKAQIVAIGHLILVNVIGIQLHFVSRILIPTSIPITRRHPHRKGSGGNEDHGRAIFARDGLAVAR